MTIDINELLNRIPLSTLCDMEDDSIVEFKKVSSGLTGTIFSTIYDIIILDQKAFDDYMAEHQLENLNIE